MGLIKNFLTHFFSSTKTFMEFVNKSSLVKFEVDQTIINLRNNQIIVSIKITVNSANKFKARIKEYVEKKLKSRFEIPRRWNCEIFGEIPGINLINQVPELITVNENNVRYLNIIAFSKITIIDNSVFNLRLTTSDFDHIRQSDFVYYNPESYPERDFENERDIFNKQVEEISSINSGKYRIDGITLDICVPADIYLFDLFPKDVQSLLNQIEVMSNEIEESNELYKIPQFRINKLKKDFLHRTGYDLENLLQLEIDINSRLVLFIKDEYRKIFLIQSQQNENRPVLININPIINTHFSFDTHKMKVKNVISLIFDCSITSEHRRIDFDIILDYGYLTKEFKTIVRNFCETRSRLVKKTVKKKKIPENDKPFWS